ncbi:hypothetical protein [Portibacter lacus]|uniref:hypothetical protein n=1 Tax=Portibacter lacus TaxID=1099794 RepID=UPI001F35B066|nr:hypothetical protein [Portibacter lacus]
MEKGTAFSILFSWLVNLKTFRLVSQSKEVQGKQGLRPVLLKREAKCGYDIIRKVSFGIKTSASTIWLSSLSVALQAYWSITTKNI